jgi:glycosyltransferase involved in cell wall biosynthesis
VDQQKIIVSRLGVGTKSNMAIPFLYRQTRKGKFNILAVGRLHVVKNHAFLIQACARLRDEGLSFECSIAGSGPELKNLETLIRKNRLQKCVRLLGHVVHSDLDFLYRSADLFVMTSLSEGIPLVLMEAMACGTIVLAPAITGIPELVNPGKTGFLYQPGNPADFVQRLLFLQKLVDANASKNRLHWIRHAGKAQVRNNFNRSDNLRRFGATFMKQLTGAGMELGHANSILQ